MTTPTEIDKLIAPVRDALIAAKDFRLSSEYIEDTLTALSALQSRLTTLEAENARLKEIEEDHQQHIQFWANAAGDEAIYKASWIRAYKKLEAENAALQARVDGARKVITEYSIVTIGAWDYGVRAREWLSQPSDKPTAVEKAIEALNGLCDHIRHQDYASLHLDTGTVRIAVYSALTSLRAVTGG